jgi:hypothetical protein
MTSREIPCRQTDRHKADSCFFAAALQMHTYLNLVQENSELPDMF